MFTEFVRAMATGFAYQFIMNKHRKRQSRRGSQRR